jgi:hypothetical protein
MYQIRKGRKRRIKGIVVNLSITGVVSISAEHFCSKSIGQDVPRLEKSAKINEVPVVSLGTVPAEITSSNR